MTSTRAEVAILGNGVGGFACAARLARHGIRPLLIGRGLPVDRPPLTKAALADGRARLLSDEQRLAERGIDRLEGHVDDADLGAKRLRLDDGTEVEAEAIVLATGLRYGRPPIPGIELATRERRPREPRRDRGGARVAVGDASWSSAQA